MCWRRRYERPPSVPEACWARSSGCAAFPALVIAPQRLRRARGDRLLLVVSIGTAQVSAEGLLRAMLHGLRESRARTADLLNHPGLRPLEVSVFAGCAPATGRGVM
jgi:hypothetical protein